MHIAVVALGAFGHVNPTVAFVTENCLCPLITIETQVRDKMFGVIHTEVVEDVTEENTDEISVDIDDIPVDLEDLDVAG